MINWIKSLFSRPFHQLWLIQSTPFGEIIHPMEFRKDQTNDREDMERLARAVWHQYWSNLKTMSTLEVVFKRPTRKSQQDKIVGTTQGYMMGRHSMRREFHPVTSINITD